jgi:hypothetical protein
MRYLVFSTVTALSDAKVGRRDLSLEQRTNLKKGIDLTTRILGALNQK